MVTFNRSTPRQEASSVPKDHEVTDQTMVVASANPDEVLLITCTAKPAKTIVTEAEAPTARDM